MAHTSLGTQTIVLAQGVLASVMLATLSYDWLHPSTAFGRGKREVRPSDDEPGEH